MEEEPGITLSPSRSCSASPAETEALAGLPSPKHEHSAHASFVPIERVLREELVQVNMRREWVRAAGRLRGHAPVIDLATEDAAEGVESDGDADFHKVSPLASLQVENTLVGLSLSGGGIRSAAFSLGVLQVLSRYRLLDRIDYLSTVSGGGYIGGSLMATAYASFGEFLFAGQPPKDPNVPVDIADTPAVQHLRNYSNFLIPNGAWDLVTSAALIVRGIVTNAIVVLPYLLLAAALTLLYNPVPESLEVLGAHGLAPIVKAMEGWYPSAITCAAVVVFMFGWSLFRSTSDGMKRSELKGWQVNVGGTGLVAILVIAVLDAQTRLLQALFAPPASAIARDAVTISDVLKSALVASPFLAILINAFKDPLIELARDEAHAFLGKLKKHSSRLVLAIGAATMPFFLWAIYLWLVYSGLAWAQSDAAPEIASKLIESVPSLVRFDFDYLPFLVFLLMAIGLLLASHKLTPNSYSLHRLYRDRLGTAFVVHPEETTGDPQRLRPLYNLRISDLVRHPLDRCSTQDEGRRGDKNSEPFVHGPFPLMNTALNVQASEAVNKRGRNADFFVFTPLHAGSPATGYVNVKALEKVDPNLELASILAISGAAASSNMGANTIRPLTFTLALLNIRLGYWLPNPKWLVKRRWHSSSLPFLWREMTSGMTEELSEVLLTDGGHIENLGIYELLRRRAKLIIAVDAEADGDMSFSSLVTLQRYARIDLGVRIDLPWRQIAEMTAAQMTYNSTLGSTRPAPSDGPHAALGKITYDDGTEGAMLYIKSSLTGDENDYIVDYARRNPTFPHETTADQFFSEEQFEAYRALGFHVARGIFSGDASISVIEGDQTARAKIGWKRLKMDQIVGAEIFSHLLGV